MDNYICINGKKAELTEEQLKKLGIKLKMLSSFDRQDNGSTYYSIISTGEIAANKEHNNDYNCISHFSLQGGLLCLLCRYGLEAIRKGGCF